MKINISLDELIRNFNSRYMKSKSVNKDTLTKREIDCYEFIFSFELNGILYGRTFTAQLPGFKERFSEYSEHFDDYDIFLIKKAYAYFIVNGADLSEAGRWYQNNYPGLSGESPTELNEKGTSFIQAVTIYYDYLLWLKGQSSILDKNIQKKGYVDTLEKACKGPKELETLRNWFIQNGFCDPNTFKWNEEKYTLSSLAGYLKDLYHKGYAKNKLKQIEIKEIAKNSFKTQIGKDTIKRAKKSTPEIPTFE